MKGRERKERKKRQEKAKHILLLSIHAKVCIRNRCIPVTVMLYTFILYLSLSHRLETEQMANGSTILAFVESSRITVSAVCTPGLCPKKGPYGHKVDPCTVSTQ